MTYNETLQNYNDRLEGIYNSISQLPILASDISFIGEPEKEISIECERPDDIIITSDITKSGVPVTLPGKLDIGVTEVSAARYKDKVFLFGGWSTEYEDANLSNKIYYYDINKKSIFKINRTLDVAISGIFSVVYNDLIYLIGGETPSRAHTTIYTFDPKTYTVSTFAQLPHKVINPCGVLNEEEGCVYLVAGNQGLSTGLQKIIKIDILNQSVTQLEIGLPTPVYYAAHAVIGDRLYVLGGQITNNSDRTKEIQYFDFKNHTVGKIDLELSYAVNAAKAETVDGVIYILGGYSKEQSAAYKKIQAVDIEAKTVKILPHVIPYNSLFTDTCLIENTIYSFFGKYGKHSGQAIWCFTPYKKSTCVITLTDGINSEIPIKNKDSSIKTIGNIDKIYLTTENINSEVNWSAKTNIDVVTSSKYNFGTTENTIEGYICSSQFTNEPDFIEITNHAAYYDDMSTISASIGNNGTDQCAISYGRYIYIFGKWDSVIRDVVTTIWKYDTVTGSMTTLTNGQPHPVSGQVAVRVRDKIYLLGGYATGIGDSDRIYEFDPATETIKELTLRLPAPIVNAHGAVYNDNIYIAGGRHGGSHNAIMMVNPIAGISTTLSVKLPKKVHYGGYAQSDSKLYIVGGICKENDTETVLYQIQYFDIKSGTTGTIASLPYYSQAPICAVIDGYLYIYGVQASKTGNIVFSYCLDTITNELHETGMILAAKANNANSSSTKIEIVGFFQGGVAVVGNDIYQFGGQKYIDSATSGGMINSGVKYSLTPKVLPNSYLFHATDYLKGITCSPYTTLANISVPIDAIYKGDSNGLGVKITDAKIYNNKQWKTL